MAEQGAANRTDPPGFERRRAGVLLPLGSLRQETGAASLQAAADRFLQFLGEAGFSLWQMLPVQPPDEFGSPYRSVSVHAGDPALIDTDAASLADAHRRFLEHAAIPQRQEFDDFCRDMDYWLGDYSLFAAARRRHGERPWWEWPAPLRDREPGALASLRESARADIDYFCFEQYLFFSRWQELRRRAQAAGILLLGDMPLYPAHDSADVWAHRGQFKLDEAGRPLCVAGVPPDYFSATGQRWGNPVYDWEALARSGFRWWLARIHTQLALFDLVRLDHFRGLEAAWEIPFEAPTAEHGYWSPVPGRDLLSAVQAAHGALPFVAEDLGTITPEVRALRREFGLPGMKVLQFAFGGGSDNPYLPHNHAPGHVVYTGTHDNNTTLGWFAELGPAERQRVTDYLGHPPEDMPWPLIRAALASVCRLAVVPAQDLLGLGAEHRLNTPGTSEGNWNWHLPLEALTPELAQKLRALNELYGRC